MAAWIVSWAALTAALGLTTAILLMAANGFVQAVRSLFLMQSFDASSARRHGPLELKSSARWLAFQVDLGVLFACLALLFPIAFAFNFASLPEIAAMMLIMTVGLPARTPALLALDRGNIGTAWRLGSAMMMLAAAAMVLLLDLHWAWGALAIASRDWGGLLTVWARRGHRSELVMTFLPALDFTEIAARTSMAARRRLIYRLGKITLSVLGPVGTIIARTSRGSGLDGQIARRLAVNPLFVGMLALACSAAIFITLLISRGPPALLIASVIARVAAAALSVVVWWRWHSSLADNPDWLNEDL